MKNPNRNDWLEKERKLNDSLVALYKDEEILWAQRAKVNWLQLGDRNTRYFNTEATVRKRRNENIKIKDDHGNWWEMENLFI